MASSTSVLVLAKEPLPGRVKTRLCPPCTPAESAAVAEAALADTLDAVARCRADRRVLALDGRPGPWLPSGFEVIAQVEGAFTDRLAAAWGAVAGPTVQIGMDTPQVTDALLDEALDAVTASHDSALGMAVDGGWWALALRTPDTSVFDGVPMSTGETGRIQHVRLRERGLEPVLLPMLRDIDTMDDARAVADVIPASRTAAAVAAVALEGAS